MKLGLVIACVAMLGSVLVGAGVADAGTGAARSFSFSPGGGFVNALAAAVDQSNGDVYVSDFGINSLWEFKVNLAGESAEPDVAFGGEGFVREPHLPGLKPELDLPFQPVVDEEHNVLVPTLNDGKVRELSPTGEEITLANLITDLEQPTGVGVDGSGNIYVSQLGGATRKFNSAGTPVDATGVEASKNTLMTAPTGVRAIAVDSTGEEIYLATEDGVIQYHLSGGAYVQGPTFGEGFTTGVAVAPAGGPAAGDIFVEAGGVITDYEPSGKQLTSFGREEGHPLGGGAARLAVYSTPTGTAVFAPNGSSVEVYDTFPAPTVTAEAATEVQRTTATVDGTVNPEGMAITGCFFEYGTSQRHACDLSGAEIGTGNAPVAVSAKLEGLEAGTNYPFHLVVEFEGHVISSTRSKLSTQPVATATTGVASNVITEGATLNATVNLFVGAAKYHFQYIQEGAAEPHTTEEKPLAVGEQTVTANLTGLAPNKQIFFRVVVVLEAPFRPIEGGFAASTTKVGPPVISNESASHEERHSARLAGEVTPENGETTYYFEYATEMFYLANNRTYNGLTPAGTIAAGEAGRVPLAVAPANLSGLAAGTVYHYRLVAINAGGTTRGPDQTFTINEDVTVEGTDHEFTTPGFAPVMPISPEVKPVPPLKGGKGKTRAQRYAKEVKRCKKIKSKKKRTQCLLTAKKNFGPVVKKQ
ncbi:MAG TPA: hypothetical protein VNY52_06770 [Solirubrobacteraceae bacterium]|jgi:hypothetical protein|nr:hypothetical protein [Solirubrobacteraceae bacterium]